MLWYEPSVNVPPVDFRTNVSHAPPKIHSYCGGLVAHVLVASGDASSPAVCACDASPSFAASVAAVIGAAWLDSGAVLSGATAVGDDGIELLPAHAANATEATVAIAKARIVDKRIEIVSDLTRDSSDSLL